MFRWRSLPASRVSVLRPSSSPVLVLQLLIAVSDSWLSTWLWFLFPLLVFWTLTTPVLWQHLALCLPFPVWKVYFISEILQVPLMIMLSRFSLTLCNSRDCSPPGSSVRGILQARIMEWVDVSASRGYSQPRDQICFSFVSCIGRWVLYHLRKPEICWSIKYLGWSLKSCCFFCWSMCGCVILLGYREWPVLKMN